MIGTNIAIQVVGPQSLLTATFFVRKDKAALAPAPTKRDLLNPVVLPGGKVVPGELFDKR